jgi:hypothetical protein
MRSRTFRTPFEGSSQHSSRAEQEIRISRLQHFPQIFCNTTRNGPMRKGNQREKLFTSLGQVSFYCLNISVC